MVQDDTPDGNSRRLYGVQVASTFGAEIAVGTLLGWWLDGVLGWTPWLMIAGATLAFGGGFYHLIRDVARREQRDRQRDEKP